MMRWKAIAIAEVEAEKYQAENFRSCRQRV